MVRKIEALSNYINVRLVPCLVELMISLILNDFDLFLPPLANHTQSTLDFNDRLKNCAPSLNLHNLP